MDVRTLLDVIRSRWVIVAVSIAACLLSAAAVTATTPKTYQSEVSFFISMSGVSTVNERWEGTQVAQFRLSSYAHIAAGREVAQRAIDKLGLDMDAQTLANSVTVHYDPEAVIFDMTVSADDPDLAVALANEIAQQFVALVPTLEVSAARPAVGIGRGFEVGPIWASATIVDPPSRPSAPVAPNPTRNLGLGLIAGVLLGLLLAVLREKSDQRIRSAKRIERAHGEPPVAILDAVISLRGAGIDFGDTAKANEQYRALRTRLLNGLEIGAATVYVTSAVTMPAKSVVAVDLAAALADVGASVALVPADPASTALRILGLTPRSASHQSSGNGRRPSDALILDEMLAHTAYPRLTVVDGNPYLFAPSAFRRLLAELTPRYDYIIVEGTRVLPDLDAGLQARQCGGSLLLVQPNGRIADIKAAVAGLDGAGATVIGVALVKAIQSSSRKRESAEALNVVSGPIDFGLKQAAHAGD